MSVQRSQAERCGPSINLATSDDAKNDALSATESGGEGFTSIDKKQVSVGSGWEEIAREAGCFSDSDMEEASTDGSSEDSEDNEERPAGRTSHQSSRGDLALVSVEAGSLSESFQMTTGQILEEREYSWEQRHPTQARIHEAVGNLVSATPAPRLYEAGVTTWENILAGVHAGTERATEIGTAVGGMGLGLTQGAVVAGGSIALELGTQLVYDVEDTARDLRNVQLLSRARAGIAVVVETAMAWIPNANTVRTAHAFIMAGINAIPPIFPGPQMMRLGPLGRYGRRRRLGW